MLLLEVNLDSRGAVEEETTLECSAPGDINHHGDGGDFTRMMLRMLMIISVLRMMTGIILFFTH